MGEHRGFVRRQIDAVRRGGSRILWFKIRRYAPRLLGAVLAFVPAVLAVLAVRLIRPWLLVRTGWLFGHRIGHFVGNTEVYLCEKEERGVRAVDLLSVWGTVSNRQVERMWRRVLHLSWFYGEMHRYNRRLPGSAPHIVSVIGNGAVDATGATARCGPHLAFTDAEVERGRRELAALLGDAPDARFVCLHARDAAFLRVDSPLADASYHNHRDSDVDAYLDAARLLADRGYFVVRMGAAVDGPFGGPDDVRVIDYAMRGRSEFMDVFLEANCTFHLGDPAGINEIPRAFRHPVASANFIPLVPDSFRALAPGAVFIPKLLHSRELGRVLTFREFRGLDVPLDRWSHAETYDALGLTVVNSTAEQIAALAAEMADRVAGSWVETEQDRARQQRFWDIFEDDSNVVLGCRIGTAFLRENGTLLD